MEHEDLIKWFINKFNSCYPVLHDNYTNRIFLFYDENVVRKMKLCQLSNFNFNFDTVNGRWLFILDYKKNILWCNYDDIWTFFKNNYIDNYDDIKKFIKDILQNNDKLKVILPTITGIITDNVLEEKYKLKIFTPSGYCRIDFNRLDYRHNFKILTTNVY